MRTLLLLVPLAALAMAGCSKRTAPGAGDDQMIAIDDVPSVTIDQLDELITTDAARAVDANGEQTRKKLGVIPGAILLTDSETFTATELGPDKARTLVFYCANTHCNASHDAAAKARMAGYANVRVLPEGIAGWVKANKQTTRI